nr:MAG TPA_asm: hypothetical protein [Bacteriophage sp.]
MPMGGWTTYCPPYAAPRRMRRAVAPTACRSMPGVSDRPEKRFRYSAVAPGVVPLSGGGIDTNCGKTGAITSNSRRRQ